MVAEATAKRSAGSAFAEALVLNTERRGKNGR
jgi:hypothetical protein